MADNVAITAGTGTTIAADDISGVLHQRVKISQGADGSATDVSSAAPLQVTLANTGANATAVKVDGSAVTQPVSGTFYQATQPVSAASLPLPTGASTAAKQPALGTAGTASADVISVQGIASMTALKVDGSAVTQPVSLASAVAVTQSGTWDEVGINDSGNSITVDNAQLSVVGSGTEATALRVTLASDSTGVVSVDDNGGSLTVDGTVTATLAAETTKVIGTVNVAAGQTIAVTNAGTFATQATLQTGANAIGKLAANSGVDIGDVDVTTVGTITPGTAATSLGKAEDAAHSSGDVGVMALGIRNDALAATAGTDLDYLPPTLDSDGRMVTVSNAPKAAMVRGTASVTDTTTTSLIAAGAGSLRNYITAVQFANTGSTTVLVTLQDGSGGTALARTIIPAGGGSNIYYDIPLVTTAATALFFAAGGSSTTVYASAQGYRAL